jgi:hypothetical protein
MLIESMSFEDSNDNFSILMQLLFTIEKSSAHHHNNVRIVTEVWAEGELALPSELR